MDIFKFNNPQNLTQMEQGEVINHLDSKMWIERYATAGEFTLVTSPNSGAREKLPIGTFISHANTLEIMIVENHEINENEGQESTLSITGRGFETFLENRIIGSNKVFPIAGEITDYTLAADFTWNQAVQLIKDYTLVTSLVDFRYAIPYMSAFSSVSGSGVTIERPLKRGPVYNSLLELLAIDNLGIKVIRPGPWSPFGSGDPMTAVAIHKGTDKTKDVVFSYDTGEIVNADYLWSNKKKKNAVLVTGKWVELIVDSGDVDIQYKRRMTNIDAHDIDDAWEAVPVGADLDSIVAKMQQRGLETLSSLNDIVLTKAEVSKESVKALYRRDFDVGDLITVNGDYNEITTMRVSEYVEIEDETGEKSYPTVTL